MGNPTVRADAGPFPHRMADRIAGAIRSAVFRGEGGPSPAALRAASAREGLSPPADRPVTREEVLRRVASLRQHRRGKERAPHKPLLLLLALGRLARGEPRLASYEREVHDPLGKLLRAFGPPRKQVRPEFPFWHLVNDGLWEIEGLGAPQSRAPQAGMLKRLGISGGLPRGVEALLKREPDLARIVAERLLHANFPESLHDEIRDFVGVPRATMVADEPERGRGYGSTRPVRDPRFREAVLIAYERRCAVCDFDLRLGDDLLGLDAAHIRWRSEGGPDEVRNGLALCIEDHRALDRGAIGLERSATSGYELLVSRELSGRSEAFRRLVDANGRPLRPAQAEWERPDPAFVAWHRKQVFRGDPRPR